MDSSGLENPSHNQNHILRPSEPRPPNQKRRSYDSEEGGGDGGSSEEYDDARETLSEEEEAGETITDDMFLADEDPETFVKEPLSESI